MKKQKQYFIMMALFDKNYKEQIANSKNSSLRLITTRKSKGLNLVFLNTRVDEISLETLEKKRVFLTEEECKFFKKLNLLKKFIKVDARKFIDDMLLVNIIK